MSLVADPPEVLAGVDPKAYARRYPILATMCLSLVLIVATVSSVNVAIPSLAGSALEPTDTQILWIVDSYALVFAAFLLLAGALGDRFGRKGALLIGLVIFAVASFACAWMPNPNALIACRAVMGIGAALIMPSTLSLLQSSFPPAERAKAIAIWAGFAGAGGAIGPLIGGLLLRQFWYGSVFLVAAPIATVAFIASLILAPSSREPDAGRLDPVGALLSITGFGALLFGIIEGPERGWTDLLVVASLVLAVVCLVGFVLYERGTTEPMLDMSYFANPRFAMGSLGITFSFMVMFAMFFVLTQYLQYVRGYSALGAGVRGLPFAFGMIAVSPRSPAIAAKIGTKRTVGSGMALLAVGLLLMSFAGLETPFVLVAVALVVSAAGIGLSMPSLSTGILESVPMNKAGVGSAVNDTTRELGGAIGIAVIGTIVNSIYRSKLDSVLAALPPEAADAARDNVAKALGVAQSVGAQGGDGDGLVTSIREAFVAGGQTGLRIGAALIAVAAVIVVSQIPDRPAPGGPAH